MKNSIENNLNENKSMSRNMEFFITIIEQNNVGVFFDNNEDFINKYEAYYGHIHRLIYRLRDYSSLISHNGIKAPRYLEEVLFLSKYIDLLFKEAKKENGNLVSVFESENDKIKFYHLLKHYLGLNANVKMSEIENLNPLHKKINIEEIIEKVRKKFETINELAEKGINPIFIDEEKIILKNIGLNIDFFINVIKQNNIGEFFDNNEDFLNKHEAYYGYIHHFFYKLQGFYNFVTQAGTQEPKYLEEIIFLSKYIDLLFKEAKKENGNLLSIFESEENKNKFYQLLPEYFGKNFNNKIMEIRQHTPGFTKEDDEKLAQESKQQLEKEKAKQEKKDKELAEKLKGELLTEDEKKAILSIFDEE